MAAGVAIGPNGLEFFDDPLSVMHVAEFGVVLFLFLIGLELNLARLWSMRRDIFGVGAGQVVLCGVLMMLYPLLVMGRPWEMVEAAEKFGFRVYYGDGSRLDVLRAAGAEWRHPRRHSTPSHPPAPPPRASGRAQKSVA